MQAVFERMAVNSRNLFVGNLPRAFWKPVGFDEPDVEWEAAAAIAERILPAEARADGNLLTILSNVLGEGQFGAKHWELGSATRAYFMLKPALPRRFTRQLRRLTVPLKQRSFHLGWPIEDRYVLFQKELVRQMLKHSQRDEISFVHLWPGGANFAFALSHDIETGLGQRNVMAVADLEEELGFRSCFNFVPRRYPLDRGLMHELRSRGFEIGVHDLHHDGKLFETRKSFEQGATQINAHLREFDAVGFGTAMTVRQPEWMQQLEIEYDSSFFDTDPYEPVAGGTMSIWPFQMGHFIELPYTLTQDYTLLEVLQERTPEQWLKKVEFLARHWGLVLLNSHPDYLFSGYAPRVYRRFLESMAERDGGWHALPCEVARWWESRRMAPEEQPPPGGLRGTLTADLWED